MYQLHIKVLETLKQYAFLDPKTLEKIILTDGKILIVICAFIWALYLCAYFSHTFQELDSKNHMLIFWSSCALKNPHPICLSIYQRSAWFNILLYIFYEFHQELGSIYFKLTSCSMKVVTCMYPRITSLYACRCMHLSISCEQ